MGLSPFLRASGTRLDAEGLVVRVPSGPGWDRLRDPGTAARLEQALTPHLEAPVPLRFEEAPEEAGASEIRITPQEAQQGRLRDLLEQEPGLRAAVQELDLELLD